MKVKYICIFKERKHVNQLIYHPWYARENNYLVFEIRESSAAGIFVPVVRKYFTKETSVLERPISQNA